MLGGGEFLNSVIHVFGDLEECFVAAWYHNTPSIFEGNNSKQNVNFWQYSPHQMSSAFGQHYFGSYDIIVTSSIYVQCYDCRQSDPNQSGDWSLKLPCWHDRSLMTSLHWISAFFSKAKGANSKNARMARKIIHPGLMMTSWHAHILKYVCMPGCHH